MNLLSSLLRNDFLPSLVDLKFVSCSDALWKLNIQRLPNQFLLMERLCFEGLGNSTLSPHIFELVHLTHLSFSCPHYRRSLMIPDECVKLFSNLQSLKYLKLSNISFSRPYGHAAELLGEALVKTSIRFFEVGGAFSAEVVLSMVSKIRLECLSVVFVSDSFEQPLAALTNLRVKIAQLPEKYVPKSFCSKVGARRPLEWY